MPVPQTGVRSKNQKEPLRPLSLSAQPYRVPQLGLRSDLDQNLLLTCQETEAPGLLARCPSTCWATSCDVEESIFLLIACCVLTPKAGPGLGELQLLVVGSCKGPSQFLAPKCPLYRWRNQGPKRCLLPEYPAVTVGDSPCLVFLLLCPLGPRDSKGCQRDQARHVLTSQGSESLNHQPRSTCGVSQLRMQQLGPARPESGRGPKQPFQNGCYWKFSK